MDYSQYTLEEQKAHRQILIKSLRSGSYARHIENGRRNRDGYTLFGVASEICPAFSTYELSYNHQDPDHLPDQVRSWFGFTHSEGHHTDARGKAASLLEMDDAGASFQAMAQVIEDEPAGLIVLEENLNVWE